MVPLPEKEKAGFGGMDSGQFGTTTPNKDPPPQPPRLQEQDQVTSLASASASISSPASTTSSPGRPSDSASNNASFASASTSTFTAASLTSPPRRKRMSFAPPRLSLDAPLGDLTSWTEELFSSIPSAREDGAGGGKPWESKGRRDSAVLPSAGSGGSSSASAKGSPASASVVPKGYPPRGSSLRRKPQQEVAEEPAVRPHEREREREMTDGSTVSDYSRRSDTDPSLDLSEFPSPPSYSSFAPIGAQTASPPSTAAPNVTSPKTKHKPVPLTSLGRPSSRSSIAEEGDAAPPATTPLWNELLGMVRQDSPGVASVLVRSPALDEGEEGSPVIPATLSSPDRRKLMERLAREAIAGRSPLSAGMTVPNRREEEEDEDDEFLLPGVTRRGDNRDSNLTVRPERDSASTLRDVDRSSAEGASIVRGAVVAYATKANVIGAGVRSRSGSAGTSPVEKRDVGRNEAGADLQPRTDLRQDRGLSLLLEGVHQTIEGVDEDEEPEDEGSGSGSASRSGSGSAESGWTSLTGSSRRQTVATSVSSEGASDAPKTPKTPSLAYLQATPSPSPSATQSFFELDQDEPEEASDSASDDDGEREEKESQETETVHIRSQSTSPLSAAAQKRNQRPRIVISGIPPEANSATTSAGKSPVTSPAHSKNPSSPSSLSPATPAVRYRGWLAEVLAPLDDFINDALDPRERYVDLREIAEGESGSVYAARVVPLPDLSSAASHTPSAKAWARAAAKDSSPSSNKQTVAIKNVQVSPTGSPKIGELKHELSLMRGLSHPNILTMDGLYMDLVEDSLWIRMELMERSLADVIGLVEEGLEITEVIVARFASDILSGLSYLQTHGIAHRDVRSDNMLLNCEGVLKLADFSNGVRVTAESPTCSDVVGVVYWQAPEVRSGSYDALKVDVWSLGATIWETLQTVPPFSDVQDASQIGRQWPPLDDPDAYSRSLHDFLARCSMPAASRPTPKELLATPFIRSACRHSVIAQLLSDCTNIETRLNRRQSGESMDSQGTVS
ncbi:kinase-like protein [Punctularia strigosozonata HHB-11173 SS5]|uniref:kinase-like protein n=1 Tax=Punctularia strigosozonata (strain HHB-11173) TaxID=741275 RepID=UPI00044167CF|nr:kinase-like protein [Punctularia strigosozonata HHB-11173 SS5]EIN05936.1 kinase-like protein [Punctularia strigosozonata HHB-11173 SS5]